MKTASDRDNNHGMDATAAAIRVIGDPAAEWGKADIFRQALLFKAAAILVAAGAISGALTYLWGIHVISIAGRDILLGSFYILTLGGALWFAGKLSAKRAAMVIANAVVFLTWNAVFTHRPQLAVFIIVFELWLPIYWIWTDPGTMKEMGLGVKGVPGNLLIGLIMGAVLFAYFAFSMKIYGFTFKIDKWKLIVSTAQMLPVYLLIFCFFYIVWNKLKSRGLSTTGKLMALAVLSASLNLPVFTLVSAGTGTPAPLALAGFTAVTVVMALSTHFTFGRLKSAIPAACLFTSIAALLQLTGLT